MRLYCGNCGHNLPIRPPKPATAACDCCLRAVHVNAPATDVFAMPVSDLALDTATLNRLNQMRAKLRAERAGQ